MAPLAAGARARLLPSAPTSAQLAYCRGRAQDVGARLSIALLATVALANVWTPGAVLCSVGWLWLPYADALRRKAGGSPSEGRFPHVALWFTRVRSVEEAYEPLGEAEVVVGDGAPDRGPTLVLRVPLPTSPFAERPAPPLPQPGDDAVVVVLSDDKRMRRFKALPEAYIPADDVFVGEGMPLLDRDEAREAIRQVAGWQ